MDTASLSNPPSLASSSNHSPGGASNQQQPTAEQRAAYDDALRRFQAEVQNLGFPLPGPQQNQGGVDQNSLQAGFSAFSQNCPPNHGNRWGGHSRGRGGRGGHSHGGGDQHFERVSGELPIEKFPYGTPDADWGEWVLRFEKAVQVATNAADRARLEELCLMWISLKLNDEAQPIFDKCTHKDRNWPLLRVELAEALEDPMVKRRWARHMDAYKKPSSMSLQIYRAKIIGFVNKYSPALAHDPAAYSMELYNRFVNGLAVDWREYIEESIPYSKESLDNAYSQALKYEAKLAKKSVEFDGATAAAMANADKDGTEKMRLDSREGRKGSSPYPNRGRDSRQSSSSSSGSSRSRSNSGGYRKNDFRAIQTTDEDSDSEFNSKLVESATAAFSQALSSSMKGLSVRSKGSKKGSHSKKV